MADKDKAGHPLANAAAALEGELRAFEQKVELARRLKLGTEKNLERAAQATVEAAQAQQRVAAQLRALLEVLQAARVRQEEQASALQARVGEIAARQRDLGALQGRFQALGTEARAITAALTGEPEGADVAERLRVAHERMGEVAEAAVAIGRDAEAAGLEEVARQAESLRQQILTARNKALIALQRMGPDAP